MRQHDAFMKPVPTKGDGRRTMTPMLQGHATKKMLKKLLCASDAYDARTFWNQIIWANTQKASTFGYDGRDNDDHCNVIQVLRHVRKYHFDDACTCFTKDIDNDSFIKCLLKLPTIQFGATYNLKKTSED
ncbi:hypothetical protein JHK86_001328 [Glycine max]|nr:hypothetical protein JHK86_001328 [Glycine max]